MKRPAWLEFPAVSPLLRRRLLTTLPTLFVVVTLTFILVRAAPGGPFRSERAVPEAVRENMEARYGLDRSLPVQYVRFWGSVLTARLGPSFQYPERSAASVLWDGAGPSLVLGAASLLIALLLGMGGGTAAAVWPRGRPWISTAALVALAVPVFVLGPLFIRLFAVGLGWLPAGLWGEPKHLVLPALTLGIPVGGATARFWRAALEEELSSPACLAARARGMGSLRTVRKHAAPRSLPLLLNYLGPLAAGLVTGSVVVEKVFGIPGMGRYFVDSALARDYPVVIGATLAYAVVLLAVHTAADLLHLRLDPRLRKEHADWMGLEKEDRARRRALRESEAARKAAIKALRKEGAAGDREKERALRSLRTRQSRTVDALLLALLLAWAVAALLGAELFPAELAGAADPMARPPSPGNLLGTDSLGRDLLTRLLEGMRTTMGVGIGATLLALVLGTAYGATAGLAGPKTDEAMMRAVDVGFSLPYMFLVILLVAVFGRSMTLLFIALGLVEWLPVARVVRAGVRSLRDEPFLEAARMQGGSRAYVLSSHLLPQLGAPLVVYATLMVPSVMMQEAFLSFLGLGVPPPMASWGTLIAEGLERMDTAPWILFAAGGSLALWLILMYLGGDRLARRLEVSRSTGRPETVLHASARREPASPHQPKAPPAGTDGEESA